MSLDPRAEETSARGSLSLSRDELVFIKNLQMSGELHNQMAATELSTQSIRPEQIRGAIADMHQYIDKVEKNLVAHQAHMTRNVAAVRSGSNWDDQRTDVQRTKKRTLKESQVKLEELLKRASDDIKGQAQIIEANLQMLGSGPRIDTSSPFWRDADYSVDIPETKYDVGPRPYDDLLSRLQALGWEMKRNDEKEDSMLQAARHYANEEVVLLVRACRKSLDVAFHEGARTVNLSSPRSTESHRVVETEMLATLEEIQSLWDEVVPPIMRKVDVKNASRETQNAIIGIYVGGCLDFMNERLSILAKRLSVAVYHHQSLRTAFEYAEMSKEKPLENVDQTLAQKPKLAISSDGKLQTPMSIIKDEMKKYGGFRVKAFDPLSPPSKQFTKLNEFVQQRAANGDDNLQTVHQMYEAAVKAGINDAELAARMLRDCIIADSRVDYNRRGAALQDVPTEESIAALQNESHDINVLLHALKLPGTAHLAKVLRPMFKKALVFLDREEGPGCYHPQSGASVVSCRRCQEALEQVEITRRWNELPEFRERWD
ncbi:hypothetical protein BJ170DRAFT_624089 [Xylariales sp. AK1849]|nr:hypothetical protein BJ170DRAFT_624089 [Xylariales sp. AK1849]